MASQLTYLATYLSAKKLPRRFTAYVSSKSCAVMSMNGVLCECLTIPAARTAPCRVPKCSVASSTAVAMLSSDLRQGQGNERSVIQATWGQHRKGTTRDVRKHSVLCTPSQRSPDITVHIVSPVCSHFSHERGARFSCHISDRNLAAVRSNAARYCGSDSAF